MCFVYQMINAETGRIHFKFQSGFNLSILYRMGRRPPSQHQQINDRRRNSNRIIILVTCIFVFSWLPFNVFGFIAALKPETLSGHTFVYGFLHLLGGASACTNPILYGILNENVLRQYRKLYRWLPGYYGERARRYSLPACQRDALCHSLERQNAFRINVRRLSTVAPSNNVCQSMETTEELLEAISKWNSSVNIISPDEGEEDLVQSGGKEIDFSNTDSEMESETHVCKINSQNLKNKETNKEHPAKTYVEASDALVNANTSETLKLDPITQMQDLVEQCNSTYESKPRFDKNAKVSDSNLWIRNACRPTIENKRTRRWKSSLSLNDADIDYNIKEMSEDALAYVSKEREGKVERDPTDSNKLCTNCGIKNETFSNIFSVSHNPKSPVYSLLTAQNRIRLIENTRKLDDVDSAYEDDYYSPCPTTTDSMTKNKVFNFDDIGLNEIHSKSTSGYHISCKTISEVPEGKHGLTSDTKYCRTECHETLCSKYIKDAKDGRDLSNKTVCDCKSMMDSNVGEIRNRNMENGVGKIITTCKALTKPICDCSQGISHIPINKTRSLNIDGRISQLLDISAPPKSKKVMRREEYLFNGAQKETYV